MLRVRRVVKGVDVSVDADFATGALTFTNHITHPAMHPKRQIGSDMSEKCKVPSIVGLAADVVEC